MLKHGEILGVDPNGQVICWNAAQACSYDSGRSVRDVLQDGNALSDEERSRLTITVEVEYTVKYRANVTLPRYSDSLNASDIELSADEICDIDIPTGGDNNSEYVEESFEPLHIVREVT